MLQKLLACVIGGVLLVYATGCGKSSDDELRTLPDDVQKKYLGF